MRCSYPVISSSIKVSVWWDFGLPPNIAGAGVVEYVPGATMRYDVSIIDQPKTLELEPGDVDFIAPSHLHFDHAGALSLFKGSTLLIQKASVTAWW